MPRNENLVGRKFGDLVVVDRDVSHKPPTWLCRCICGKDKHVVTAELNSGHIRSCGCGRSRNGVIQGRSHGGSTFKDLTGFIFGRLSVISRAQNVGEHVRWNCLCSCGKQTVVLSHNLMVGYTKSCGCYQRDVARESGRNTIRLNSSKSIAKRTKFHNPYEGAENELFVQYKANAKNKHREFLLTFEQFKGYLSRDCYYCGEPPSRVRLYRGATLVYNGLDRFNNDRGYSTDNVVTCCSSCNTPKGAMNGDSFIEMVYRIYHNRFSRSSKITTFNN